MEGREPVETTVYEYDEAGRLVRSVTTREPEWTEQDTAEILALVEYRAMLCPCGCGFLTEETTSHEAGGPQFEAHRTLCRARRELVEQQTAHAKSKGDHGDPIAAARLWGLTIKKR